MDSADLIIEAAWLLVSAVALGFGIWNLSDAYVDYHAAGQYVDRLKPARCLIAKGAIWRHWVRICIFGWWLVLGIAFTFFDLPDIPRLVGVLGLVATVAGFAFIGAQETRERGELEDILDELQEEDEDAPA
jgi:hypothetical protein